MELLMSQSLCVDLGHTFINAQKGDGSCRGVWFTTRRCDISLFVSWTAANWMKSVLAGVGGRSVAFSFWNVMWWSCGGFATISRKSVWIFFLGFFFLSPPLSSLLLWQYGHFATGWRPRIWFGQTTCAPGPVWDPVGLRSAPQTVQ